MKYFDLIQHRPSPSAPIDPDVLLDPSVALDLAALTQESARRLLSTRPNRPRQAATTVQQYNRPEPSRVQRPQRREPIRREGPARNDRSGREVRQATIQSSDFASLANLPLRPMRRSTRTNDGRARSIGSESSAGRGGHLPTVSRTRSERPIEDEAPPVVRLLDPPPAPIVRQQDPQPVRARVAPVREQIPAPEFVPRDEPSAPAPAPAPVLARTPSTAAPKRPPALAPISEEFRALGVDDVGLAAIAALGYTVPSPIQEAALPLMFAGGDVVGLAQTGTGKTIAFGLPLARAIRPEERRPQAIVMVPTRELAQQVHDVLDHLGRFYGFAVVPLMGGRKLTGDFAALDRGGHVIVGTPGRVIDHIKRGTLALGGVHFAVLDEADEMLDIGFARDIDYILRSVPKQRQTALFSATMPESIGRLVWRFMKDARKVQVAPERRTAEGVIQYYCEVAERDKFNALRHIYENMDMGRSLVFRRTKIGVDRLAEQLQNAGVAARPIHGDLGQGERDRVISDFKTGRIEFLVATNVAARGLDIPDILHVINYDVPQNAEEYIHRIGRTARAGKSGSAVTLVGEWELAEFDVIQQAVGKEQFQFLPMPNRWK